MDTQPSSRRSSSRENSTAGSNRGSFRNTQDSFRSFHDSIEENETPGTASGHGSPRIPRKFITNWRQACDRTRDRTKELLKRWRTMPESETNGATQNDEHDDKRENTKDPGWSVHVWDGHVFLPMLKPFFNIATWVRRVPSDEEGSQNAAASKNCLSPLQREKLGHFFTHLLDWDRDDIISAYDFDALSERLRHFADWSTNSAEFHILREVQQGFIDVFINTHITSGKSDDMADLPPGTINLEQWLMQWSLLVSKARNLQDFPLWLQYFAKIIFLVINKSNTGTISRDELRVFYSSFLGFDTQTTGEILDLAYNNMTANGDHPLQYNIFHLCFANFLLGRHPHGPGQLLFGPCQSGLQYSTMFPIDYSVFNSPPECLEQYSPHRKSNRHSVIV